MSQESLDHLPIGTYRTTPEGRILHANATLVRMLGYSSLEELTRRNLSEEGFEPQYSRDEFLARMERDGEVIGLEAVWVRRDGSYLWVRENAGATRGPGGEIQCFEGTVEDIAREHQAREALAASELRFRTLFDIAPLGIAILDAEVRIIAANAALAEMVGCAATALVGRDVRLLAHADDVVMHRAAADEILRGQREGYRVCGRLQRADGGVRWCEVNTRGVRDEGRRLLFGFAVFRDVTAARRAEEGLRASEERLRRVLAGTGDAIAVFDLDGRFEYYQGPRLGGLTPAQLTTRRMDEAAVEANEDGHVQQMRLAVAADGRPLTRECTTRTAAGPQWFSDYVFPLRDGSGGTCSIGWVRRNITATKRAEQALRRRDAALSAVSHAGEEFLRGGDWRSNIEEVLGRLGHAIGVSRIGLYENEHDILQGLVAVRRYEWVASGVARRCGDPIVGQRSYRAGFERWQRVLASGDLIYGHARAFPPGEREVLEAAETRSVAVVPIFVGGCQWGFLGFAQCDREREWADIEIEALRAAASMLGAAISQEQGRRESERLVGELQDALAHVRRLSGLLPICAGCKRIRTDSGDWQAVDVYVRDHSEAEFSHGLCPDCAHRLYPGMA